MSVGDSRDSAASMYPISPRFDGSGSACSGGLSTPLVEGVSSEGMESKSDSICLIGLYNDQRTRNYTVCMALVKMKIKMKGMSVEKSCPPDYFIHGGHTVYGRMIDS